MSQELTQPEEIDRILKGMVGNDLKVDAPVTGNKYIYGADQAGWNGAYVSPYRTAYMKSQSLSNRSDLSPQSGNVLE